MGNLKDFATYIKKECLKELAQEYLGIIQAQDIPIIRLILEKKIYPELTDAKTLEMTMQSMEKFLTSLETGTMYEEAKKGLKQWEEDKIPIPGFSRSDVHPSDLVLLYAAQKKALLKFLPAYCQEAAKAASIVAELEEYYTRVQNDAIQMLFKIQKETENKLKETEKSFSRLIHGIKDYAIFMLDDKGYIKTWNEGARRIKGYTADEIIGKHYSVFFTPEEAKKGVPEHNLELALKNGHYEMQALRVRKDGTRFWADVIMTPIYNEEGKLTGFSKITRDITEKREVEETRQRIVDILEATNDFVGSVDATDSHLLYINSAGRKMLGLSKDEDISRLLIKNAHPEWAYKLLKTVALPAVIKNGIWRGECAFMNIKTGQEVPVSMVLIGHKDTSGNTVRFSTISRDITREKLTEGEIKSVNIFLNSVLENIPNMVFVKDAETLKFMRFNRAGENLLGYSKKDLLGKNDYDFFPKEQADFFTSKDKAVLAQKDIVDIPEEPINTKDGPRWLHTRKIPILDEQGNPLYLLGISEDITEIRKAKLDLEIKSSELERSNKELEQFAYVASHDLQEPLRTISSYVQLLSEKYKNKLDSDADDFIGYIVDGSKRMRQLISSLLEFSRVNRVKPFEPIDVNDLLTELLNDLKEQIKITGASIKYDKLPKITGDNVLIGELFQNLIVNAIKFKSDKKPEIIISGKKMDDYYLFSVKDNGIGIEKEYWDKIFVMFQRLHNREQYPGTGIGLSICKKIVERHGGRMWVESEPGKGSVFYFTIKKMGSQLPQTLISNDKQDKYIIDRR